MATKISKPKVSRNDRTTLLVGLLWMVLILGCGSLTSPATRKLSSPVEIQVIRYGNSVDVEHDKIRIDWENIIIAKGKTSNEWFELEHTATCKNGASTPTEVVMTLTHETPSRSGWHFPSPTSDESGPNAGFAVTLKLESGNAVLDKAYQTDLTKDLSSDATFFETFHKDVPLDVWKKFGDQTGTVVYELPGAQLFLTSKQAATLYAFAHAALRCGRDG